MRTCDIQGCGRVHEARGLCSGHYAAKRKRQKRIAEVGACSAEGCLLPKARGAEWCLTHTPKAQCQSADCDDLAHARGLCRRHYAHWLRNGEDRPPCDVEGCNRPVQAWGLCFSHYRADLYADPDRAACDVEDCGRPMVAKGMCDTHYHAWSKATSDTRGVCMVELCGRNVEAWGLCSRHYGQWLREAPGRPKCQREGCERNQISRGYCDQHAYWDRRRNTAESFSEGTAAYDALTDVPLTQYIMWHQQLSRLIKSTRYGLGGYGVDPFAGGEQ